MSGRLSPEQMAATIEILRDDARLARALTGHIEALRAENEALRAERLAASGTSPPTTQSRK